MKAKTTKAAGKSILDPLVRKRMVEEDGHVFPVPGLARMKKAEMARIIQSLWELCDVMCGPTYNAGVELSVYGRVYGTILANVRTIAPQ